MERERNVHHPIYCWSNLISSSQLDGIRRRCMSVCECFCVFLYESVCVSVCFRVFVCFVCRNHSNYIRIKITAFPNNRYLRRFCSQSLKDVDSIQMSSISCV